MVWFANVLLQPLSQLISQQPGESHYLHPAGEDPEAQRENKARGEYGLPQVCGRGEARRSQVRMPRPKTGFSPWPSPGA